MTLTDRDRKIILALIPLAVVAAYWFLLLAPKRQEATRVQDELTQAQSERDTAVQRLAGLGAAKRSFGKDYATVIYLGKAIPTAVDMPSLMVQLDRAARGTGIRFTSIKAGDRTSVAGATGSAPTSTPSTGTTQPAAAGTSQAALDTVPLDFQFDGSYFDLAKLFHRMKRFVRVANNQILIRGRLMTLNTFTFELPQQTSGDVSSLKVTAHATVYLAPKAQGAAAGATPNGPSAPAAGSAGQTASSSSTPPAATVTAR